MWGGLHVKTTTRIRSYQVEHDQALALVRLDPVCLAVHATGTKLDEGLLAAGRAAVGLAGEERR